MTPTKTVFRCPKCRSTRSESVRVRDDAGRLVSWVQCARCTWSQDGTTVQFEFEFNEPPSLESQSV